MTKNDNYRLYTHTIVLLLYTMIGTYRVSDLDLRPTRNFSKKFLTDAMVAPKTDNRIGLARWLSWIGSFRAFSILFRWHSCSMFLRRCFILCFFLPTRLWFMPSLGTLVLNIDRRRIHTRDNQFNMIAGIHTVYMTDLGASIVQPFVYYT